MSANDAPRDTTALAGASAGRSERRRSLDGLRTVAIVAVFLFHCFEPDLGGFLGVDVFFVLSGYLMTGILTREVQRSGRVQIGRFFVRRLRRLYPALLAAASLALVLALVTGVDRAYTIAQLPFALLYLTDVTHVGAGLLDHTWSLAVEAQFYVVWPFVIMLLAKTKRMLPILWVLAGLAAALPLLASMKLSSHQLYYSPVGHIAALLAGSAIALMPATRVALARVLAPTSAVLLVVLLLAPVALVGQSTRQTVSMWVATGLTSVLLWSLNALKDTGIVARILSWGPLEYLGLRSYGFYLYHQPVLFTAVHFLPLWIAGPLAFLLSIALCIMSWRFLETRIHQPRSRVRAA